MPRPIKIQSAYSAFFFIFMLFVLTWNLALSSPDGRALKHFNNSPFDDTLFTDVSASLENLTHGTVAWGDYDNDGDLDLLSNGIADSDNYRKTLVYKNDNGTFTDMGFSFVGVNNNSGAIWGDYDNDGDLDFFVSGSLGPGAYNCVAKIYRNDIDSFVDINASIQGLLSTAAWCDYDNDGDLDLIVTGSPNSGGSFYTKLYRNDAGSFVETSVSFPGVWGASLSWADIDNDGDKDLFIAGYGGSSLSRIYRNDGDDHFVNMNANIPSTAAVNTAWGDYDNDGDLDLLIASGNVTDIYKNDNGSFSSASTGFPHLASSAGAFGDYDNDGDLDVLLTGLNTATDMLETHLFNNDGGTFTEVATTLPGTYYSSVAWGDFDNDGDLDIAMSGYSTSTEPYLTTTKIFRNNFINGGFSSNTAPNSPSSLSTSIVGNNVTLQWNHATDSETPDAGLTYNIRVGLTAGGMEIESPMSDPGTGKRLVVQQGNASIDTMWTLRGLAVGTYYWSVQTIDGAFAGSSFAAEDSFVIVPPPDDTTFTEVDVSLPQLGHGTIAWGDYDNDNDLDILITGIGGTTFQGDTYNPHYSLILRNDSGSFVDIGAGLTGVHNNDGTIWNDYDHDGDLDLFIGGGIASNSGDAVSKIYRNDSGSFTDIDAGLVGVIGSASWGDIDNDGDLDLLVCGSSDLGMTFFSRLYRNEDGVFVEVPTNIPGVWGASIAWGDYDNDGDLDLLMSGYGTESVTTRLYRNDGNGDTILFVDTYTDLARVNSGTVTWGDYDNDGDLDILLCGYLIGGSGGFTTIYRNDSGSFVDIHPGMVGVGSSQAAWVDFDNDGDLDVFLTGQKPGWSLATKLYRNTGGTFTEVLKAFPGVFYSGIAWGDYDNDGDLDLLLSGFLNQDGPYNPWTPVTKLYRNNSITANNTPSVPGSLHATMLENNSVNLEWNESSDAETPDHKLTYNLRLGTTPTGNDIITSESNVSTGFRHVARPGNADTKKSFMVKDLPNGTYYWSVQSVDNVYVGSGFAETHTFVVGSLQNWQLVSVPYHYDNMMKETLFPSAQSSAFSFYDEATGYVTNTELQNGVGYWMKFAGESAPSLPTGSSVGTFPVSVHSGWNLIGSVDHTISLPGDANIVSNFYSYNQGYDIASSIEPGKGYWVRMASDGVLNLGSTSNPKGNEEKIDFDKLNSMTITNSKGEQRIVYFGKNQYASDLLRRYELPPVPPSGIFDVRFGSQRLVEVVDIGKTKNIPLVISTEDYPVTITWHNTSKTVEASMSIGKNNILLTRDGSVKIQKNEDRPVVTLTGIQEIPQQFALMQNYPNPFNPVTRIKYALPSNGFTTLKIYNMLGQEVATLVNEIQNAGYKSVEWDASTMSSGIYFYRLTVQKNDGEETSNFSDVKRMILLK